MYASLAPRLGQTSFAASSVGIADLRGGKINWGSLGSSIANAFKTTGRFFGNAASKFSKSQAYHDIKKGLQDSGLARNVAGLAGETLSSLVDIGKMKLENELQQLRRKVAKNVTADELARLLLSYRDQMIANPTVTPVPAINEPQEVVVEEDITAKRPRVEEVEPEVIEQEAQPVTPLVTVPYRRHRIRGAGELEWQSHLNNMLGQGVRYTSSKYCS
ncbi:pVI [Psittacine adenovirus 2]|uniref:PVI n=1 Tax=Psittacine adenovirus 2 TaxID=1301246 RepID=A0ABX8SN96_9ADEN|nr:pVI-C [Psittacine adenovirus 2]QZW33250.1 ORF11 pVI [Psittacine siadenovirus F]QXX30955.1 pVI [Psittacine adenovirus 2]QZW33694.1 ORF11 pVI [Psittacine adenovirus 2]WGL41019.1 pVI [Psittacine siadenovirus F]